MGRAIQPAGTVTRRHQHEKGCIWATRTSRFSAENLSETFYIKVGNPGHCSHGMACVAAADLLGPRHVSALTTSPKKRVWSVILKGSSGSAPMQHTVYPLCIAVQVAVLPCKLRRAMYYFLNENYYLLRKAFLGRHCQMPRGTYCGG